MGKLSKLVVLTHDTLKDQDRCQPLKTAVHGTYAAWPLGMWNHQLGASEHVGSAATASPCKVGSLYNPNRRVKNLWEVGGVGSCGRQLASV